MLDLHCSMMVLPFQLQRGCPAAAKQGCQLLPWLQRHRQLAPAVRGCVVGMHPGGKLAACAAVHWKGKLSSVGLWCLPCAKPLVTQCARPAPSHPSAVHWPALAHHAAAQRC